MNRLSMIVAVALSSLVLAACGSSSPKSHTKSTAAAPSTPTTASSASTTPATTAAATTPTATTPTATAVSTAATGTTPTGGTTLAAFKAALVAEKRAGNTVGNDLVKSLQNAGSMSNATFAATFSALGRQLAAYAAGIASIQAPAKYRALLARVQKGYAQIATDVTTLSQSTTATESKARTLTLARDIQALQAVRNKLVKAVGGLPS